MSSCHVTLALQNFNASGFKSFYIHKIVKLWMSNNCFLELWDTGAPGILRYKIYSFTIHHFLWRSNWWNPEGSFFKASGFRGFYLITRWFSQTLNRWSTGLVILRGFGALTLWIFGLQINSHLILPFILNVKFFISLMFYHFDTSGLCDLEDLTASSLNSSEL